MLIRRRGGYPTAPPRSFRATPKDTTDPHPPKHTTIYPVSELSHLIYTRVGQVLTKKQKTSANQPIDPGQLTKTVKSYRSMLAMTGTRQTSPADRMSYLVEQ